MASATLWKKVSLVAGAICVLFAARPAAGACKAGYYMSATGSCVECSGIPVCMVVTCTTVTDSYCTACAGGFYLADGLCPPCTAIDQCTSELSCTTSANSRCLVCGAGYYLQHGAVADVCQPCTVIADCMGTSTCTNAGDSVCNTCASGSYLSNNACVPCSGDCPSGQYETSTCSVGGDRQCASCDANCATCKDWAGQCLTCPPGSYTNHGGVCKPCTVCGVGMAIVSACSAAADTVCAACAASSDAPDGGATCTSCGGCDGSGDDASGAPASSSGCGCAFTAEAPSSGLCLVGVAVALRLARRRAARLR